MEIIVSRFDAEDTAGNALPGLSKDEAVPLNTNVFSDWLSSSGIPTTRGHLMALYTHLNVRTVITLTPTSLLGAEVKGTGEHLVLNCCRSGGCLVEYGSRDPEMFQGLPEDLKFVHVPLADIAPCPTSDQLKLLMAEAQEARDRGARVHVHCWQGKGRAVFVAGLLQAVHARDSGPVFDAVTARLDPVPLSKAAKALRSRLDQVTVPCVAEHGWPTDVDTYLGDRLQDERRTTASTLQYKANLCLEMDATAYTRHQALQALADFVQSF